MKRQIKLDDLPALCLGAAVLGSGGGGDTAILSSFVSNSMQTSGSISIMTTDELKAEDLVIPLAYLGSPAVSRAVGPTLPLFVSLIEAVIADHPNKRIVLMPAEIGGCNALAPFAPASVLGLPMLDADLIGRAFPKVSMCKPAINAPNEHRIFYMSDRDGGAVRLEANSVAVMEEKARAFAVQAGGSASIATFLFEGATHASNVIEGSLTRAHQIGQALLSNEALTKVNGCIHTTGQVTALTRETVGGFLLGRVTLKSKHETFVIAFQNEYLSATREGVVCIQTPDLIVLFDATTRSPVASESLCVGQTLSLVSFPAPAFWREPRAATAVALDQFSLSPLEA